MLKKEFEKVLHYAKILQTSDDIQDSYQGRYAEAKALKELGLAEADATYKEVIKFYRKAMVIDPSDTLAITYRVQCCIDIGEYDEAEEVSSLLIKELRIPLLHKIAKARFGGV